MSKLYLTSYPTRTFDPKIMNFGPLKVNFELFAARKKYFLKV